MSPKRCRRHGVRLPRPQHAVTRRRHHVEAIADECHGIDAGRMPESAHFLARAHVPQAERAVLPCRRQRVSPRREGRVEHPPCMALEAGGLRATGRVPDTGRPIRARRRHEEAVRRKRDRIDGALVAADLEACLPRRRVPQAGHAVAACRRQTCSVRCEGHAIHGTVVRRQCRHDVAADRVAHDDATIGTGRREQPAVG